MNLKIYLFRLVVAFAAFILGVSFFSFGRYLKESFQTKKQEVAAIQPVVKQEIAPVPTVIEPSITAQTSSTADSEENTEYEFDAAGEYYIIGDLPKGFEDFEQMSIATKNYEKASAENNYEGISIPPEGSVFTKKEFKFVRINIADKQIAFETQAKKGISYKFVGQFIAEEEIKVGEYTHYAVLEGRLVKMKDGKKIAESKVQFDFMGGC